MRKFLTHFSGVSLLSIVVVFSCATDEIGELAIEEPLRGFTSEVDSVVYKTGVLIFNSDQGKEFWTEFNSEIRPYRTESAKSTFVRKHHQTNPHLACLADGGEGNFGVRVALFKTLFDDEPLPQAIAESVNGLRFNAIGYEDGLLNVHVLDVSSEILIKKEFQLEHKKIKTFALDFEASGAKEVVFFLSSNGSQDSTSFGLDDIYLKTDDEQPFSPPLSDDEFLNWLKRSSYNFFDWNYLSLPADRGVVVESRASSDIVSLSGIGYAYPIFIIAAEEGYISAERAKSKIKSMLQWQRDQNWFDGSAGWHGFPNHYFKADGSFYQSDVSTIDWAICAAGIRTVKQYYHDDAEITSIAEELLARPDWSASLAQDNKIAMGFDKLTGEMNSYRWGLAFSEETELIYLEAVASGDLTSSVFQGIVREKKDGFFPSWFGAGFTYNWLQLWTGPIEPYEANSISAFNIDASTCASAFNRPLMGLTACATISEVRSNGFNSWGRYISNQGGFVHGAGLGQVIQISPAPYGAALALPFEKGKAIAALREFVKLGYYHEYLGLPDNVRLKDLPEGATHAPNWDSFDINIGPIILAIEQVQDNTIGQLYLSDPVLMSTLTQLTQSFP